MPEPSEPELSNEFDILSNNNVFEKEIPEFISKNLSSRFDLRYYQEEAIARLIYYLEDYDRRSKPTQLLYHMATGSGKTLIMAASILYLYKQGYNKFIFFVDSTDTIEKTKDNFLNKAATKYLFSEKITVDGKDIDIREVTTFEEANEEDIHILFSTIQGLHSRLNFPRENAITYEDFEDEEIVLISDEAHHINALTKSESRRTISDKENIQTWEGTVNKIFQKNPENILLEYTATVPKDPAVMEKYDDKIIYQYPLKKFRIDRYSKEVEVLEGDFERNTRALQALILSQYRRKVAEKYGEPLKPVVMMKAKNISMSEEFEEEFHKLISNLEASDLAEIRDQSETKIIEEAFDFFEENGISLHNLVREFKEDFSEEKCISVNSKSDSEEKQVLVNTLEDEDNKIRVVFAVDKLNEGWDVLNLFDIVRLYETRSSRRGKPGKTTIKEAQLIGRGARYCPFQLDENQDEYKRKYDDDVENEVRILEELYYHCYNEPRYISELKKALRDTGIYPEKKKEVELKVKEDVKDTPFWRNGLIFMNERKKADRSDINNLSELDVKRDYKHQLRTGYTSEVRVFEEDESSGVQEKETETYTLSEFRNSILRKALDKLKFYRFRNLQDYFPQLSSLNEFISNEEYLGGIEVEVTGTPEQIQDLNSEEKLEIALDVSRKISREIKTNSKEYTGTKVFVPKPVNEVIENKNRKFDIENGSAEIGKPMSESDNEELRIELSEKEWYIYNENYGTDQEKYFVRFLNNTVDDLQEEYDYVYLVRNERLFQLYDFDDGQAFEPDFVLFLKEESEEPLYYQLFIEPKGEHLIPKDEWKEDFLERIKEEHEIEIIAENKDFKIIGLPFYNEEVRKRNFRQKFSEELNLED